MTIEGINLVLSALLSIALALLTILLHNGSLGGASLRGNRDRINGLPGALGRTVRAHENLNAALVPFGVVVIMTLVLNAKTDTTATASEVFFASRLAHAGLYVAGVPVLRSLAFYTGVAATLTIAAALPWPSGS